MDKFSNVQERIDDCERGGMNSSTVEKKHEMGSMDQVTRKEPHCTIGTRPIEVFEVDGKGRKKKNNDSECESHMNMGAVKVLVAASEDLSEINLCNEIKLCNGTIFVPLQTTGGMEVGMIVS